MKSNVIYLDVLRFKTNFHLINYLAILLRWLLLVRYFRLVPLHMSHMHTKYDIYAKYMNVWMMCF